MEIKPVKKYIKPEYPDYEVYVHHPAELAKYIPESWKGKKAVIGAFMAFILSGQINASEGDQKDSKTQIVLSDDALSTSALIKKENEKTASKNGGVYTAPIFNFGEGRGTVGCIAINPPVFISEAEAQKIIIDEFKKAGIEFDRTNKHIINMTFDKYEYKENKILPGYSVVKTGKTKASLDWYNSSMKFGFQYISEDDWTLYCEELPLASAYKINTKKVAEEFQKKLKKNSKINSVVFYDPMLSLRPKVDGKNPRQRVLTKTENVKDYKTQAEERIAESKEILKQQVHAFIDWLKTEGKLPAEIIKKGK